MTSEVRRDAAGAWVASIAFGLISLEDLIIAKRENETNLSILAIIALEVSVRS